jgi:hypothetical protein
MKTPLLSCVLLVSVAAFASCKREDPQVAIAAQAAATEQAAKEGAAAFDDAVAKQNWALAKAQGEVLIAEHPDSEAAKHVRPLLDEVKAKADAARDTMRTAALWSYNIETVKGGKQLSAAIYAKDELDVDGSGTKPVRLIFRDHPAWGRSAYLVLQAGDFRCPGGCRVQVKVDDAAPKAMAATRPKTDEAIAMFIEDERTLWRMTRGAKVIAIEFPTRDVGKRTALFEVAGLDRGKLPGWD